MESTDTSYQTAHDGRPGFEMRPIQSHRNSDRDQRRSSSTPEDTTSWRRRSRNSTTSQNDASSGPINPSIETNGHIEGVSAQNLGELFPHAPATMADPPPPLEYWEVASLIINKMVGTGIFTAPPTILLYTGNKREALGLWVTGFVYTIIRYA
jgi:hypothetical protein